MCGELSRRMPPRTPTPVVKVDYTKTAYEQPHTTLHNRWHPDIPVVRPQLWPPCPNAAMRQHAPCLHPCLLAVQVASVKEGELFRVETVEWTGGQIKDDDSAEDVKHVDLNQVRW